MAHIIDTRQNGGDLVVLGDSVVVPSSTSTETGLAGGLRRNPNNGAIEAYLGTGTGAYLWRSITPGIGGGGVLSVVAGTGMTGGTIADVGTIGLSNTGVSAGTYTYSIITVNAQGRITSAANGAPVTSVASGTGLTGGPITTTGTLSLANTSVTPGTYIFPVIVVDAQGRLTSAATNTAVVGVGTGTGLTGGPITSSGIISLADTAVTPGTYSRAQIVVDQQGRITSASTMPAVTSVASGTGLTGGPITTTGTLSLANTAVTPGTYTVSTIVVDAQGRITSASNGVGGGGGGGVTSVATGTGLTGGPITGTGTIALANTAVSAGTYQLHSVVVDQQGRITTAASIEPTADNRYYARRNGVWTSIPYDLFVSVSDETTDLTTGTAKVTFRVKRAMNLERVSAELNTASSSGSVAVDVNKTGSTILSSPISLASTVQYNDTTSFVSASLAVGDVITIDVDTAGTGAKGLKVALLGWIV